MMDDKGAGKGRGKFTDKGVQAQQAADLEALKAAVSGLAEATGDLAERVDALEGPTE